MKPGAPGSVDRDAPLHLVVFGSAIETHPLPRDRRLTLGRDPGCDIRVDHPSVSRQHAVLDTGTPLRIEDLGSANRTRVPRVRIAAARPGGDEQTAPATDVPLERGEAVIIAPGDLIHLGAAALVIRRGPAATDRTVVPPPALRAPAEGDAPIVADERMRALHELAARVATGSISVLLRGETGVGKELFAAAIHARSRRSSGPFLKLNCAALSETLVESELFGHEKGAFTGAMAAKTGLLESAQGGTVFLDEVGELPLATQAKLLRVLEDRTVMRVGGVRARPIDVRFVSATNRDPEAEVAAGRFRRDLLFRLDGASLTIPPLRERPDDLEALALGLLARACRTEGRAEVRGLTPAALARLHAHPWPGNIRELRNVIERALLLCDGEAIDAAHIHLVSLEPHDTRASSVTVPPQSLSVQMPDDLVPREAFRGEVRALERQRILDALARCGGNQTEAAALLGVSRRTLVYRLAEHGIPRPRRKP